MKFSIVFLFVEICLLTNARRVASVKAVVYSNLYSLDRESFLSVLENYPLMRRTMESVAAERLNKIGQNPSIVSNREDLKEDLSLVKEIVSSAVTPEDTPSSSNSDNDDNQAHLNIKHLLKFGKRKRSNRSKFEDSSNNNKENPSADDDTTINNNNNNNNNSTNIIASSDNERTEPTSDKLKLPKFIKQKCSISGTTNNITNATTTISNTHSLGRFMKTNLDKTKPTNRSNYDNETNILTDNVATSTQPISSSSTGCFIAINKTQADNCSLNSLHEKKSS